MYVHVVVMKNSVGKLRVHPAPNGHDLTAGCTPYFEYFYTLYKPVHNEKSPGA